MAKQGVEDINPTEVLLQNLLKRPDVRSTLVLSRKDGSIIKAGGLIARDFDQSSTEHVRTATDVAEQRTEGKDQGAESKTESDPAGEASCPQILASSIFHFVASATALSASLKRIDTFGSITISDGDQNKKYKGFESEDVPGEDIQLLRLRLNKQEVIIFPDPRYLCCVIQDIDKGPR